MTSAVAVQRRATKLVAMAKQRISVKPVKQMAEAMGIDDPNELHRRIVAKGGKISLNTVKVWWGDVPMGRIDLSAWETFAEFFEVKLLELVEEL
jgi:hypothetical protein